jgi:LPS export ABC transporter protein LptC
MKKVVLPALILLLFSLLNLSCKNKLEDINAILIMDTFPILEGKNIETVYSDSGMVQALMSSPYYRRYAGNNPYIEMPLGIRVVFYDSAQHVKNKLTAKYAIKYEKKDLMEAKNDVVVVNEKGEMLQTEHLIWDEKQRKIYSNVQVRIRSKDKIFLGQGMEADDSFVKWKITKLTGKLYIKDEEMNNE